MVAVGPTQERDIAQTGKPCAKERASVKQQYGPIHHGQVVEERKRTEKISGNPDNTGDQENVEMDLEMREWPKVSYAEQQKDRRNGDHISRDQRNRQGV